MSTFEGPFGGKELLPEFQTGDRRDDIKSEGESHFDKTYDVLLGTLRENGDEILLAFITKLPDETREALESALDKNGRDWKLFGDLGKENSAIVVQAITTWASEMETAADMRAKDNASHALMVAMERL